MTDSSKPTLLMKYHNMALTLLLDVDMALPAFHDGSPCPFSGLAPSENHSLKTTQETAEPFQFSPAEPVDYDRFSQGGLFYN